MSKLSPTKQGAQAMPQANENCLVWSPNFSEKNRLLQKVLYSRDKSSHELETGKAVRQALAA
jgi:hypothetical protein